MAQHRAGQLGDEALDRVEARPMLGSEDELEAACGLFGEPGFGLPGDIGRNGLESLLDGLLISCVRLRKCIAYRDHWCLHANYRNY
jgi:hypothetical protein